MPFKLEKSVIKEVNRVFSPEAAGVVCEKLQQTMLPMEDSAPSPRVHIAVIWLSEGDLEKFNRAIAGATCDWRDTLVAAGLGNEDWREVLSKNGIESNNW